MGKGCSYICQGQRWQGLELYLGGKQVCRPFLVHNNLSEILCCVFGGRLESVRFTLMSRGNLTFLQGSYIS
jgi:hypothetical protein